MQDRNDPEFEQYRRERQRRRLETSAAGRPAGEKGETLRLLEMAEADEIRDRRLSREVHEFFETATRIAAGIVSKVAEGAQAEAAERLATEMRDFLLDALRRMNGFVQAVVQRHDGPEMEACLEPQMRNLVGRTLDGFRALGSAAARHLGQDPFATDPDEVQRELQKARSESARASAVAAESTGEPLQPAIEEHLVAELHRDAAASAAAAAAAQPAGETSDGIQSELERFKAVLKGLVRQGLMSKDEARAAWRARIEGREAPAAGGPAG